MLQRVWASCLARLPCPRVTLPHQARPQMLKPSIAHGWVYVESWQTCSASAEITNDEFGTALLCAPISCPAPSSRPASFQGHVWTLASVIADPLSCSMCTPPASSRMLMPRFDLCKIWAVISRVRCCLQVSQGPPRIAMGAQLLSTGRSG